MPPPIRGRVQNTGVSTVLPVTAPITILAINPMPQVRAPKYGVPGATQTLVNSPRFGSCCYFGGLPSSAWSDDEGDSAVVSGDGDGSDEEDGSGIHGGAATSPAAAAAAAAGAAAGGVGAPGAPAAK